MEPQIQYVHSDDGVSIAYWTLGDGDPPLVVLPPLVASHIALEWQYAPLRAWYESLAARRKIVRYDWRGQGLSERHVRDISLGPLLSDLDAVTQRLRLRRYAIFSTGTRWQVAVACAVRRPERVSHLVVLNPVEMRAELTPRVRARREMFHADWEEYTEIIARTFLDRRAAHLAPLYAQFIRQAIEPEAWSLLFDIAETKAWEMGDRLVDVRVPALVIVPTTTDEGSTALAQRLASRIPDGRLVVAPGGSDSEFGFAGLDADTDEAIDRFLGGDRGAVSETPSGMTAIFFADIAHSTELTERMGDTAFRAKARDLEASLRSIITEAGGAAVDGKLLGDGVLATFPAASQAIAAALRCASTGGAKGLPLHLGLHAGDVIREANNVFGGAVNIASRISGLSAPGEVLVSATVRDLARTSAGVTFEDRGEHALKGIAEPQRVFAVRPGSAK